MKKRIKRFIKTVAAIALAGGISISGFWNGDVATNVYAEETRLVIPELTTDINDVVYDYKYDGTRWIDSEGNETDDELRGIIVIESGDVTLDLSVVLDYDYTNPSKCTTVHIGNANVIIENVSGNYYAFWNTVPEISIYSTDASLSFRGNVLELSLVSGFQGNLYIGGFTNIITGEFWGFKPSGTYQIIDGVEHIVKKNIANEEIGSQTEVTNGDDPYSFVVLRPFWANYYGGKYLDLGLAELSSFDVFSWRTLNVGDVNFEWYINGEWTEAEMNISLYRYADGWDIIANTNDGTREINAKPFPEDFRVRITVIDSDYYYGSTEKILSGKKEVDENQGEDAPGEDINNSDGDNDNSNVDKPNANNTVTTPNNNVIKNSAGEIIVSTIPTYVNTAVATTIRSHKSEINYASDLTEEEKEAGITVMATVYDSQCGENAKQSLKIAADSAGAQMANVIEIHLEKVNKNGSPYSIIDSFTMQIEICLSVPTGIDGNKYDFAVVSLHDDGSFDIYPDIDTDAKTITFKTDKPGIFSIIYYLK